MLAPDRPSGQGFHPSLRDRRYKRNLQGGIATGVTTTLLTRAADVTLKERRRLVLLVRETPLHTGHLRTMTALSEIGAVIAPPVPAFYAKPQTIEEMIDQTLGRVLDLFGLDAGTVRRWGEPAEPRQRPLRAKPRRV